MLKLPFIIIFPNYNTVILISTQTMDRLKQLLDKNNFTYTEKTFESEEDIAGLGSEPFVSDSRTKELLSYILSYHFIHHRIPISGFISLHRMLSMLDLCCVRYSPKVPLHYTLTVMYPTHRHTTMAFATPVTCFLLMGGMMIIGG